MNIMQISDALSAIRYKDWSLRVGADASRNYAPFLQWRFNAACVKTGEICEQPGRKWYLSEHMTESELVGTAFKAALTAEEHECREAFTYHGCRVFNPHLSVRVLMTVCDEEDVRRG